MDDKKIKTREIVRDIKVLDKSKVLTDKIKTSAINTKENIPYDSKANGENNSPHSFAEEKVNTGAKDVSKIAIGKAKDNGVKQFIRSIKLKRDRSESDVKKQSFETNNKPNSLVIKRKLDGDKSGSINSASKLKSISLPNSNPAKSKFVSSKQVEILNKSRSRAATAYKAKSNTKRFKQIGKATSKYLRKIILAAKSLITALSSFGIVVVVIIIIVCFIGFLSSSPMGIFFSNDIADTKMVDTISKLNIEFFDKIELIKKKNKHDDYELKSTDGTNSINWNEVLAVYAVKTSIDPKNAMDVVSVDEVKEKKLKTILYDMNKIKHKVTTKKEKEKNKTYDIKVLTVTIIKMTPVEMAKKYKFTAEQSDMLTEILKPTYDELWTSLIYGSGGNGEIIAGVGSGQFAWPVPGYAANTSSYGMRKHPISGKYKMHTGTDLGAPTGTKIVAAENGKVVSAGWNDGGYGYFTILDHGKGLVTRYAHQSRIITKLGSPVKRGQVIGLVGSTGASTGPHLHFEVLFNGDFDDPLKYIQKN